MQTRPDLSPELFRIPNDTGFPKLSEVVEQTSPSLALDLEVKYPQWDKVSINFVHVFIFLYI